MGKDNKVVRAITGVTCVMLVAKALGMLRSILQARVYGAGPDVDLFTQASNYTVSVFTTVCYALCVAAIPLLTQTLLRSREAGFRAANKLISNTLVLALLLAAGATALTGAGLTQQLLGVEDGTGLFRFSFTVLLWALPVIVLTYLLLALFQSMGHFTLQGSLSLLYGLVLCAVLLIFGERLSLRGFVVLTSAGWLLQLLMTVPAIKKERYRFHFTPDLRWPEYRTFLRTGAATVFNSSLLLLCYLVNTRFAAAGPEGTLSAFFYANKLYEPLTTTLIYSVSIVLFPKFSQQYGTMPMDKYRQYVVHVTKNTLLLILPLSLLFSAFGDPIIRVLFQGGSFTAADAAVCGGIFAMYALGMAGFFMLDILNKAYYAMGRTLAPTLVTAGVLAFCLIFNGICTAAAPEKPWLLALGTSLGFLLGGLVLYLAFARSEGVKMPVKQLVWGTAASLLMGAAAFGIYTRFIADTGSKLGLVAKCGGLGLVCMLLYLLLLGPMVPTREILSKLRGERP